MARMSADIYSSVSIYICNSVAIPRMYKHQTEDEAGMSVQGAKRVVAQDYRYGIRQ
jgi:hypothetical protein